MHLGEKLKLYRKKHDLDQPQMAERVGVSYRTYQEMERTGIIKKAKDISTVKSLLEEKEQNSAQNETQKQSSPLPLGGTNVTLADYIQEIKENNAFLRSIIRDRTSAIHTNLEKALEHLAKMEVQGSAARSVVLRSLSRLEKKPEQSLISEVDREIMAGFSEQRKPDNADEMRK